jgi:hemoglobin
MNVRLIVAAAALVLSIVGPWRSVRAATLFEQMGGATVLHAAVDRFTDIVEADSRINFTFAETDLSKFKNLLYEQLCELSGGPCRYTGRDMRTAHQKLMIDTAQFDALAEDLYLALGRCGVPYRLQNKLMAKLAPMKRDIVK